jgi:Na+-driven multidrug efflux pump
MGDSKIGGMRTSTPVLAIFLLVFAALTIGMGLIVIFTMNFGNTKNVSDAVESGLLIMGMGVPAIAGLTIVFAIDDARKQILAVMEKR